MLVCHVRSPSTCTFTGSAEATFHLLLPTNISAGRKGPIRHGCQRSIVRHGRTTPSLQTLRVIFGGCGIRAFWFASRANFLNPDSTLPCAHMRGRMVMKLDVGIGGSSTCCVPKLANLSQTQTNGVDSLQCCSCLDTFYSMRHSETQRVRIRPHQEQNQ